MKKILFPTDFSKIAENAFLNALSLADKINGEVTLLHVYELPELGRSLKTTTKEVYEIMEMEALEQFRASVKRLRKIADENNLTHIKLEQLLVEGETVYQITKIAEKLEVDYILLGTKGTTGLEEIFLGSVASGVIESSKNPVICIPEKTHFKKEVDNLAYLTNYKKEEVDSFKSVLKFSNFFGAKTYCIHFDHDENNGSTKEMEVWKNLLGDDAKDVSFEVVYGENIDKALLNFKEKIGIDLIAAQPRKKNIFERIFMKSFSKSLAHHLNIPLLTLPKK